MVFNIYGHGGHFGKQIASILKNIFLIYLQIFTRNLTEISPGASEHKASEIVYSVDFETKVKGYPLTLKLIYFSVFRY